jgi:Transcriptional antiterminator
MSDNVRYLLHDLCKDEFEVGLKANQVVEEETGVRFLEDEAAFIALHFVNALLDEEIDNVYDITPLG